MHHLVGQTLGQYQVLELIGQGGMAQVFKAYQPTLDRHVAIKALSANVDHVRDLDLLERFHVEARVVARLAHPHIVPVHDFGEDEQWAYIVMEYISGGTLRERLVAAEAQRAPLHLDWVLLAMEQAARALECAHENGVIHRDVKPGNMLLRSNGHLLLSDFGIAAILAASTAGARHGSPIGTPQYMAPEQGIPNGIVDARTDIYSLGVVLYHAVTGRLPFVAETPLAIIMKHVNEAPPRPAALVPGLPASVEGIILRALAKDPGARYQHAAEMAAELEAARTELRRTGRTLAPTRPTGAPVLAPATPTPVPVAPTTLCFRCGATNSALHRFCTSCGYDLAANRGSADRYACASGDPLRCRMTFANGPLAGRGFVLHQDVTTLGRTIGNDIVVPDGTVSRYHARVYFAGGQWLVEDLQSSNGTWINGTRVQRPTPLMHGDELRLGDDVITFELLDG